MEERILEQCHQLFMKLGIRSVTMDEIALRLGVSKKTIYQYFKDKNEILMRVVASEMTRQEKGVLAIVAQGYDAIEEKMRISTFIIEKLQTLNPHVVYEIRKYYPEAWSMLDCHTHEFVYQLIIGNIQRGQQERLYRAEIDPVIIGKYYLGIQDIVFNSDLFPSDKYSLAQVWTNIHTHFMYGICTPLGIQRLQNYLPEPLPGLSTT
jgi:AcrR family transcriptional regulator